MHILLTNDDGIDAPGLAALYNELTALGRVTVVAPSVARSGAGHSITLERIVYRPIDEPGRFAGYCVEGTPADCVKLALDHLVAPNDPVDLVVAGLNHGANLGRHVYYSGTVAAAMEGAFHGLPAVAVSAAYEEPLAVARAAVHARHILEHIQPIDDETVINLNIPPLSQGPPKGVRAVPHAPTGYREVYSARRTDDGRTALTFSNGHPQDADEIPGTDAYYIAEGYITLSVLRTDMNDPERNDTLQKRLDRRPTAR